MARGASNLEDRPTSRRVGALGALWPFVRPYRGQMALALVALVVTSAISLILPLAARRVVDNFDDGAGLQPGLSTGVGLANVREHLSARYGTRAAFALTPAVEGRGVCAEIRVPLFINEGDKIRVDTRTCEYMERA